MSVTVQIWIQVFWVISVQSDLRNTLPKSRTFLLLHPVCIYVCMYLCIRECIYLCMYTCMFVCTFVCLYECMHVWFYVCMYVVSMYECVGEYLYIYICMDVRMYICICMYVCTRMYVNIYRVSHELRSLLRESVPYVKLYRYNPKHLYQKLNG